MTRAPYIVVTFVRLTATGCISLWAFHGVKALHHLSDWSASMDPQTLANAQTLVARAADAPAVHRADDGPHGITSDEGVIRYLADRRRAEHGEYF